MPTEENHDFLSPKRIRLGGIVAGIIVVVVVVTGIVLRATGDAKLRDWTEAQAVPTVTVALPGNKVLDSFLDLPDALRHIPVRRFMRASAVT